VCKSERRSRASSCDAMGSNCHRGDSLGIGRLVGLRSLL
jgi:hypothetical protein